MRARECLGAARDGGPADGGNPAGRPAIRPAGWTWWVPGPLPGLNDLLAAAKRVARQGGGRARGGGRWNGYAALKAHWQRVVTLEMRAVGLAPVPVGARVHLLFEWHEAARRRDPDNIAAGGRKLILDALVHAGIVPGDGWATIAGWTDHFLVSPSAGVRVTLFVVGE